ncbi:signal peptidase II [Nitriliruptoraceae bacterium ZYF776]|nr:signal peptidase II [Profundirhabdus halotolerans]
MTTSISRRGLLVVAAVTVTIDLAVKAAAVRWVTAPIELPGVTLRVTRNPGVAFGIGADQPFVLVAAVTGLIVAILIVAAWRGQLGRAASAGLIIGGGVANLADRLAGGAVVDLFDLGWWPVFNLADVALTAGIALLLLASVTQPQPSEPRQPSAPNRVGDRS